MRSVVAGAVGIMLGLAYTGPVGAGVTVDPPGSDTTASGTIIWSDPGRAPAQSGPNGTIIWRDEAARPGVPASPSAQADRNGIIWNDAPRTAPATAPTNRANSSPPRATAEEATCREFQTDIVIDGRRQPAHGTACRQPDGSWRVVNR